MTIKEEIQLKIQSRQKGPEAEREEERIAWLDQLVCVVWMNVNDIAGGRAGGIVPMPWFPSIPDQPATGYTYIHTHIYRQTARGKTAIGRQP